MLLGSGELGKEVLMMDRAGIRRQFGKLESHVGRRMGVAVAHAGDVDTARMNATEAASRIVPRLP